MKLGESVVLAVTAKGRYMEFNWVKHGDHPDDDITISIRTITRITRQNRYLKLLRRNL